MKNITNLQQIKKLKVFSYTYEVIWVKDAKAVYKSKSPEASEEESDVWGWCDFAEHHIYVDDFFITANYTKAAEILLHEWIHAGHDYLNLEDKNTEEEYTAQTAKMFMAFMKDNPAELQLILNIAAGNSKP